MPQPSDSDILVALCREYIEKRPVPSPASPHEIVDELKGKGFDLELDEARRRLDTLFDKYGVEDDRPDVKRTELVKRAYPDVIAHLGVTAVPAVSTHAAVSRPPPPPPLVERLVEQMTPARLGAIAAIAIVVVVGFFVFRPDPDPDPDRDSTPTATPINPSEMDNAKGDITYCTGTDVASGQHARSVAAFNRRFSGRMKMQLKELGEDADRQYEEFSRVQRAASGECDVLYSDVIWTADFVQNGWLVNLSRYRKERRQDDFVASMVKAATIDGETWGIPKQAQAGLLYYRTDHVTEPPTTWQDLYEQAAAGSRPRLRYQGRDYEGLTVNFLEIALAAGAKDIVTPEGKANIDQAPARAALQFMVDGIDSAAPPAVLDQLEGANERAFQRERAYFMRNWPTYEKVLRDDPGLEGRFATVGLPMWEGGGRATVLGGHILVISKFSDNPGAALAAVNFLSSSAIVKGDAVDLALAPALRDLWEDPDVQQALPSYEALREGVFNASLRPLVANYQEVSRAIYDNVHNALKGRVTPEEALVAAQDQMQQALDEPPSP